MGDGRVGTVRWFRFKRHAGNCEECSSAFARMKVILAALESMPRAQAPVGFTAEVLARLASGLEAEPVMAGVAGPKRHRGGGLVIAGIAFVGVAVGAVLAGRKYLGHGVRAARGQVAVGAPAPAGYRRLLGYVR